MSFGFNKMTLGGIGGGSGREPVIEALSITPTATEQTIVASEGVDGYSPILVDGASTEVVYSDFSSNAAMTLANGIIYRNNISGTGYIDTGYNVTFTPAQWEKELIIQAHIKTPSSFNDHGHWILGSTSGAWNTCIGLTINKDAGYTFWFMLGQTDTTLSMDFSGTTVPQLNTEYWVRLYKPNTETESHDTLFQISTDGINWTTEASRTIANISSNYTTTGNLRLMNGYWGDTTNQFDGGIYFDDDTFISVDGEKVWYLIETQAVKTTKYGASINNFLGDVDANGVYQEPLPLDLIFNGVKTVGISGMSKLFENDTNINSVSFPDLETASSSCFLRIFYQSINLESASFPKLTTIQSYAFSQSFGYCRNLTSINFSSIEVINSPQVFANAFAYCLSLENVSFPKLKELSGSEVFYWSFSYSTSMTSISFPALRSDSFGSYTNQFNGMLYGVTGCTVHFPSNLQSVIGSWSDVTNGFGGTNTTVLFDLTATE